MDWEQNPIERIMEVISQLRGEAPACIGPMVFVDSPNKVGKKIASMEPMNAVRLRKIEKYRYGSETTTDGTRGYVSDLGHQKPPGDANAARSFPLVAPSIDEASLSDELLAQDLRCDCVGSRRSTCRWIAEHAKSKGTLLERRSTSGSEEGVVRERERERVKQEGKKEREEGSS